MAFDPDKFLKEETKPPFDPDKFLAEPDKPGIAEAGLLGAATGASFGFAPTISGGLEAIGSAVGLKGLGGRSFADIRAETEEESKRTFGEAFESARDVRRQIQKEAQEAQPGAFIAGEIAGSLVTPLGVGKTAITAAKIGAATGGLRAFGASEAETLAETAKDVATGALIEGVLGPVGTLIGPAFNLAKSGLKNVAKLIPATKDSLPIVNSTLARLSKLSGSVDATAKELTEFLSNTSIRRAARKIDSQASAEDVLTELTKAAPKLKESVGAAFRVAEQASLGVKSNIDGKTFTTIRDKFKKSKQLIKDNPGQLKGPTVDKIFKEVDEILKKGRVGERAGLSKGQIGKTRTLEARRALDSQLGDRLNQLSSAQRKLVTDLRDDLQQGLRLDFSGNGKRISADKLFSDFKSIDDKLFKPLKTKKGEFDPTKVESILKTGTVKGREFDKNVKKLTEFLDKNQEALGTIPEMQDAIKGLQHVREVLTQARNNKFMNVSTGGPSSQALLNIATIGASSVNPMTLLALPIINPAGWARIVDTAADLITFSGPNQIAIKKSMDQFIRFIEGGSRVLVAAGTFEQTREANTQRKAQAFKNPSKLDVQRFRNSNELAVQWIADNAEIGKSPSDLAKVVLKAGVRVFGSKDKIPKGWITRTMKGVKASQK